MGGRRSMRLWLLLLLSSRATPGAAEGLIRAEAVEVVAVLYTRAEVEGTRLVRISRGMRYRDQIPSDDPIRLVVDLDIRIVRARAGI